MKNTKEKEIWRDVPGYEGCYQVSNMGDLRSLTRTVITSRGERTYKGRIIKGSVHKNTGYKYFTLNLNGEGKTFSLAQIVAITFLNHKPDGHAKVIDHVNGNRLDDRVENLRIVTNRDNTSTCFRSDSKNLSSKFTGVSWGKNNSKWQAHIQYEGELVYLGLYDDELKASEAYQDALARIEGGTFNVEDYKPKWSSSHKGVTFDKASNRWRSQIWINGKSKYLGLFNTELEAFNCVQKFKKDNNINK